MTQARDLQDLVNVRAEVVRMIGGADADALSRRPEPDRWSPLEIFEHIVLAERFVLRGLPDPGEMKPVPGGRRGAAYRAIVAWVLTLGIPVRAPSEKMVPSGGRDLATLKTQWDENEEWIRAFLERADRARPAQPLFFHPVAGALTFDEAIRLDRIHVKAHLRQLRRSLSK